MNKANPVAAESTDLAFFPDDATMYDESDLHAAAGGVVVAGETLYSLSRPELVVGGENSARQGGILARRAGRITIANHATVQPTTFGGEAEYIALDPDSGHYSDRFGYVLELYGCMVETGAGVSESVDELQAAYSAMARHVVGEAEGKGVLLSPVSVFGQRVFSADEQSTHPYVVQTAAVMERFTGFSPIDVFRVAGWQPHTRISNLPAALQAAEAMQLLNPIFAAPSLAGPFLHGTCTPADHHSLTGRQQRHLRTVDMLSTDLAGDFLSYRYPLRRIGSPSAGIWSWPAPDSIDAYLADGHAQLASGHINTIDRFRGWHTDRIRTVLDGTGSTTFEGCGYDTFGGNVFALTDNHVLHAAVFTALEAKAIKGENVRELVAQKLGLSHLPREERLRAAHRTMLAVSRNGTDSNVYGKTPGQWLRSSLFALAEQAPYIQLEQDRRLRLLGNFATLGETMPALTNWSCENHTVPTMHAYHELGLNAPAVYMRLHSEALPKGMPLEERIRHVELTTAQAFHAHVGSTAIM